MAKKTNKLRKPAMLLTIAVAKDFLKNPKSVDLNCYSEIADDAAKELAKYRKDLHLNGLLSISDDAAKWLGKHKEDLYLDGITELSEGAAKILARRTGSLSLCGLTKLPDQVAEILASHRDSLDLDGIAVLSERAASALARHKGWLSLKGLTKLPSGVARELLTHQSFLDLDGLKSLSDDVADALSEHKGKLSLGGLKILSNRAAMALAKHESQGRISVLEGKFRDKISGAINRITITGPFYLVTLAEVDPVTADRLINGQYDKVEWSHKIEEFPSWQCIHGAECPTILLNNKILMNDEEVSERAENNKKIFARSRDDKQYPIKSVFLDKRARNKYFFICREVCKGEEHQTFMGEFDESHISINRISVWADDKIADVFQVEYADGHIVDDTSGHYDAFFVFHDGKLTELD